MNNSKRETNRLEFVSVSFPTLHLLATIPMLTTEEGEFRIELDGGDFDDIDEVAAADFKQALADTGDAEMQEDYYRLKFELESLNKSKKAIIDGDVAGTKIFLNGHIAST